MKSATKIWLNTVGWLLVASQCALTFAAPQTPGAPSAPDARKWGLAKEIAVNLTPHPRGGDIREVVPPGVMLLVRLWSRPPAVPLHIKASEAGRPETQHEIPAATGALVLPAGLGPECEAAGQAILALHAARRVEDADSAQRAFTKASERVSCPQLMAVAQVVSGETRVLIPSRWQLAPGEELRLVVQEVVAGGGASATWNVTLAAEAPARDWSYANEQEWMAAAVIRDIVGLFSLASGARSTPPAAVRVVRQTPSGLAVVHVELTIPSRGPFSTEATLEPSVLSPLAYEAVTQALAKSWKAQLPKPQSSSGLISRLTDLRAETLKRESDRVGDWLSRRPLDPAGNEEAALIHLSLALRESAGRFTDIRSSLARATAHLSVSALAGPPTSAQGRLARAALLVLTGRQVDVLPSLQSWLARPSTPAPERAWVRALTLRVTQDWRIAPGSQPLTLLERLELFRARRATLGGLLAADMFAGRTPEPLPDWSWIALAREFTVEEGNASATGAFPATLAEFAAIVLGKELSATKPDEIAAALQPGDAGQATTWRGEKGSVQVLDRATWTAFFARHLVSMAGAADRHLRSNLGDSDEANAFAAQIAPFLKGTPWPIALEPNQRQRGASGRPADCATFVAWVKKRPETVPATVWNRFCDACDGGSGAVPPMMPWFAGAVVPGTVLGLAERTETRAIVGFNSILETMQALAPYDAEVARVAVVYGGKQEDPKTVANTYAVKKDYSLDALGRLANAERSLPEVRRIHLEQMCRLSADECDLLAEDFADAREDPRAVETYEKVLKEARDRVRVSNGMNWLAAYYLDAGRPKDAERVARAAAGVGSATGLALLGSVQERLGRLSEAEAVFKAIEERYNDRTALDLFYVGARRLPNGQAYEDQGRRAMERFCPAGLEQVRLSDLSGSPLDGVTILQDTRGVRQLGLAKGDVIVALDGYRTRNLNAYRAVRELSQDQKIDMIAWSASRRAYVAAQGRFLNRRFSTLLQDAGPR